MPFHAARMAPLLFFLPSGALQYAVAFFWGVYAVAILLPTVVRRVVAMPCLYILGDAFRNAGTIKRCVRSTAFIF